MNKKIALIGEAYGKDEEWQSREAGEPRPFVGGAGGVLDGILASARLNRSHCHLDNLINERPAPASNDFSLLYKNPEAHRKGDSWEPTDRLANALEALRERFEQVKPNVIVPLGGEALYWLTGELGITKWRGSILQGKGPAAGFKVIPSLHPAGIMRKWENRPLSIVDFNRIREEARSPDICLPERLFMVAPTYGQVIETLHMIREEEYLSFDIETRDNQIACLALAWSPHEAICIPFSKPYGSYWDSYGEEQIWLELALLFSSYKGKLIAQNYHYDKLFLERAGVPIGEMWMDTMLAHHTLYPELRHGLDLICSTHTREPYYKEDGKNWEPGTAAEVLWNYNCKDACVTCEIALEMENELGEWGVRQFFHDFTMPFSELLYKMMIRGIRFDFEAQKLLKKEIGEKKDHIQEMLNYGAGYEINVKSPKQVGAFLYEDLGLPTQTKKRKGGDVTVSTDEDSLWKLYSKFPNPAFQAILAIRGLRHREENWLSAKIDDDGRIRTSYSQSVTVTGRLSSRKTVWGTGFNLQNLPRD